MKKGFLKVLLSLTVGLIFAACTMSNDELAKEVKKHMNETWRKEHVDLECTKVILVNESGNKYTGTATINAAGDVDTYSIEVIYDGETFQWEIVD